MSQKFTEQQNNIMRTAFLTAFPKIFTDIDYSMEIFSCMRKLVTEQGFTFQSEQFSNAMSLEIEARHKAVNRVLDQVIDKDTLVIELASGLSPRRLQYQKNDYAELDFAPITAIKKSIYPHLSYQSLTDSLFAVDLSDTKQMRATLTAILQRKKYKKIAVVSEGLFWYLSKEIIANLSQLFKKMFHGYDWCWISADCPCDNTQDFDHRKVISASAKVKRGVFVDNHDFKNFFAGCGLTTQCYQLSDLLKYEDLFSAKFFSVTQSVAYGRMNSYTSIALLKNA